MYTRYLLTTAIFVVLLSGCTKGDHYTTYEPETEELEVYLDLDVQAAATRAMNPADEGRITSLSVLVFREEGQQSPETFQYKTHGSLQGNGSYKVSMKKTTGTDRVRIVTLANLTDELNSAIGDYQAYVGQAKDEVLQKIVFETTGVWDTDSPRHLPMWGQTSRTYSISESLSSIETISMVRSVARLDIVLNPDKDNDPQGFGNKFKLKDVVVYNVPVSGSAAPLTANMDGVKALRPTVSDNVTRTKRNYTANSQDQSDIYGLARKIYIPEANNNMTPAAIEKVTCLVISGYYDGSARETWYRIDLKSGPGITDWADVLRNHRYIINITSVEGPGYPNEEEAFNSLPSNLGLDIVIWNEHEFPDVTTDGQYTLKINTDSFRFFRQGTQQQLLVTTDYPTGWKFDTETIPDWITVDTNGGGMNERSEVGISCTAIDNLVETTRSASILLTAGRIQRYIEIVQLNKIDMAIEVYPNSLSFPKSPPGPKTITVKVIPEGSTVYFTETPGDNPISWVPGSGPADHDGKANMTGYRFQPSVNNSNPSVTLSSLITVYIKDTDGTLIKQTVTVTQLPSDLLFEVTKQDFYDYNAGRYSFSVESGTDWHIYNVVAPAGMVQDGSWSNSVNDPGVTAYGFNLSANHSWSNRTATFRVAASDEDFIGKDIDVIQTHTQPSLSLATNTVAFGNTTSTATQNVAVTSNARWMYNIRDAVAWTNVVRTGSESPTAGLQAGSNTYNTTTQNPASFAPRAWDAAYGTPEAGRSFTAHADFTTVAGGDATEKTHVLTLTRVVPSWFAFASVTPSVLTKDEATVRVTVNTNAAWSVTTSLGAVANQTLATPWGPEYLDIVIPSNYSWTGRAVTVGYSGTNAGNPVNGTALNVTQPGYTVGTPSFSSSTISENGQTITVNVPGDYPDGWIEVRATGVSVSESGYTDGSRNTALAIPANTTGNNRAITFAYRRYVNNSWESTWTDIQPVIIQPFPKVYDNVVLTVAPYRVVALENCGEEVYSGAGTVNRWSYSMGLTREYDGILLDKPTSYEPNTTTGCAGYYEGDPEDPKTGVGQWRLPTYWELLDMYKLRNEIGNLVPWLYWSSNDCGTTTAYHVNMKDGALSNTFQSKGTCRNVRCVRSQ